MSHSQFHSIRVLILRHAWLNLLDKHMTTGRINQVDLQVHGQTRIYAYYDPAHDMDCCRMMMSTHASHSYIIPTDSFRSKNLLHVLLSKMKISRDRLFAYLTMLYAYTSSHRVICVSTNPYWHKVYMLCLCFVISMCIGHAVCS